jgi:hypothetical protein
VDLAQGTETITPAHMIPIPGATLLINFMMTRRNIEMEEGYFDALRWRGVVNEIERGNLLVHYTDGALYFNRSLTPTSILITDAGTANRIFNFAPKYVNFGLQEDLLNTTNGLIFNTARQTTYLR